MSGREEPLVESRALSPASPPAADFERWLATYILGEHRRMQEVRRRIVQLAPTDLRVAITGPPGTGKRLTADALHAGSRRAGTPLVIGALAGLPEQLQWSLVFGHKKGSFTGATHDRRGLFSEARDGNLLLEDINLTGPMLQQSLLEVLQTGHYRPIGFEHDEWTKARVFATSNEPLPILVSEGRFRADLYYRMKGAMIELPALRAHLSDLPIYVRHILGSDGKPLSDGAMNALHEHSWPGNVRELESVLGEASVLSEGMVVEADDIARALAASLPAERAVRMIPKNASTAPPERQAIPPPAITEGAWKAIERLIVEYDPAFARGRRRVDRRRIVEGIAWRFVTGCAWRSLGRKYGPWSTLHSIAQSWRQSGLLALLERELRQRSRLSS